MKGLLLKEFIMVRNYCKSFLLIAIVFIAVSFVNPENAFFMFYPCLICGMIPVTLLSYDEKSGWQTYSCTMPYTRGQLVSSKYVFGLIVQGAMAVITCILQVIKTLVAGGAFSGFLSLLAAMLAMALFVSAVCLPLMFRFGVEKGRIAYYVLIGLFCAVAVIVSKQNTSVGAAPTLSSVLPAAFGGAVVIYAASWLLSVRIFNKKEMTE